MTENIKIVRISSGEEIICQMVEAKSDNCIALKKAAIIIPTGEGRLGLSPYLPYAELEDDTIEISKDHIMWVVDPVEDFSQQYYQSFVSNLFIPSAGSVGPMGAEMNDETPSLKLTT